MDKKSGKLDYWRNYFRSANSDIFEVLDNAILVAATDFPAEFQKQRDRIAEKLFSSHSRRCFGCDRIELAILHKVEEDGFNGGFRGDCGKKESKVNSNTNDHGEMNSQKWVSNYSHDQVEALTEEIEEEIQMVGEVMTIKEILCNKDESEGVLFESLRRLQLMGLTVELLKATQIGKHVNVLRKHGSKQIRQLAWALIEGWKDTVDEWVNAAAAIARGTPESVNPSVVDEEGLPSPPLDLGAFFTTTTTSIKLSRFFDSMDDDGNPQNTGEFNKNRENRTELVSENYDRKRKQQTSNEANEPKENKSQMRKQKAVTKQTEPSNNNFGRGRPPTLSSNHNDNGVARLLLWPEVPAVEKKPLTGVQDISTHEALALINSKNRSSSPADLIQMKLEASGRNLQERYQQFENAKKQHTVQVMELRGPSQRNSHLKPEMQSRQ